MEYHSAIESNEILPFVATWMDMQGFMLSEIKSGRQTPYDLKGQLLYWCKAYIRKKAARK